MPLSCTSLAGGPTSAFMRPPYIGGKPRARPLARSEAHPSASGVKRAVKGLCIACHVGSKLGAGHPGAMHLEDAPAWIWGQRPGFRRRRHAHLARGTPHGQPYFLLRFALGSTRITSTGADVPGSTSAAASTASSADAPKYSIAASAA